MASSEGWADRLEGSIPFLMLAVFGVCAWRTDLRALGYGVIVFLMVLFGLSCVLVAGAGIVVRQFAKAEGGREPPVQRIVRSGWFWAYALFVIAFFGLWPWR